MKVIYVLMLLVLLGAAAVIYKVEVPHTRLIDTAIRGVHFQLGTNHSDYLQPETFTMKGSLTTIGLRGLRTFTGTVSFDRDSIPVPQNSRETTIHFDKNGYGPVVYSYIENPGTENAMPRTFSYGVLFANADFSAIAYLPRDGWNGADGFMFAGPAETWTQALGIANELMGNFLQKADSGNGPYVLK